MPEIIENTRLGDSKIRDIHHIELIRKVIVSHHDFQTFVGNNSITSLHNL